MKERQPLVGRAKFLILAFFLFSFPATLHGQTAEETLAPLNKLAPTQGSAKEKGQRLPEEGLKPRTQSMRPGIAGQKSPSSIQIGLRTTALRWPAWPMRSLAGEGESDGAIFLISP